MTTSVSRMNQIGGVFAIVCAVLLMGNLLGFGSFDSAESPFGWLLPALLPIGWFTMLFALYRRVEVSQSTPLNKVGVGVGVVALGLLVVAVAAYVTGNRNVYDETAGAFAAFGILSGLIALALLGVSAVRLPELGIWRIAPVCAAIPVILLIVLWSGFWNETLAATGVSAAAMALVGTGVLLWTSAK